MKNSLRFFVIILLIGGGSFAESFTMENNSGLTRRITRSMVKRSKRKRSSRLQGEDNGCEPEKRVRTSEESSKIKEAKSVTSDVDVEGAKESELPKSLDVVDDVVSFESQALESQVLESQVIYNPTKNQLIRSFVLFCKELVNSGKISRNLLQFAGVWGYPKITFLFELLNHKSHELLDKILKKNKGLREKINTPNPDKSNHTLLQEAVINKDSVATEIILKYVRSLELDNDMLWSLLYEAMVENMDHKTLDVLLKARKGWLPFSAKLIDVNVLRDLQERTVLDHFISKIKDGDENNSSEILGKAFNVITVLKKHKVNLDKYLRENDNTISFLLA